MRRWKTEPQPPIERFIEVTSPVTAVKAADLGKHYVDVAEHPNFAQADSVSVAVPSRSPTRI